MIADLIPIIETVPNLSGRVEIAVSPAEAMASNRSGPWVWLTQVRGRSEPNSKITGALVQRHTVQFAVLTMVQGRADMRGQQAFTLIEPLREQLQLAVLGWQHADDYNPAEHVSDQIAYWGEGKLYWLDIFETFHYLRKTP